MAVAWLLASALWREHTRRSGAADSLQHARLTALDGRKAARTNDDRAEAVMALAETMVLSFDLYGGPDSLTRALFDAACDQFTPDHSPMDWAAVTLARSAALPGAACLSSDGGQSDVLGGLTRSRTILGLALADAVVEGGVMKA